MDKEPVTLIEWLGLPDWPNMAKGRVWGVVLGMALVALFLVALIAMVVVIIGTIHDVLGGEGAGPNLGAGGLIVALLGAPFLIWSTVIKHNTLAVSRQTLALSETALFNDKVNAALEGLYSRRQITRVIGEGVDEKVLTEWEDDIVQRNGAIDRLEGLANERPSEVPRIANMLSVYVRELSRGTAQSHPRQEYAELVDPLSGMAGISKEDALAQLGVTEGDVSIESLGNWANALKPFRTDVEKAAQTLGRLLDVAGADATTIDLRGANLQGFDLNGLCLNKAKLQDARMEGANLRDARMEEANLSGARMEGADLSLARMEGANLSRARLEGANLTVARMDGANLSVARMEGTKLTVALMDSNTVLMGAKVLKAGASFVDFSDVPISLAQVKSMFGDASVTLPNGIIPTHPDWPEHWPKFDLGLDYYTEWKKWKADPSAYVPPVTPDSDD